MNFAEKWVSIDLLRKKKAVCCLSIHLFFWSKVRLFLLFAHLTNLVPRLLDVAQSTGEKSGFPITLKPK